MSENKWTERKITTEDEVSYVDLDPTPGGGDLGRAEFVFCPVWARGRMRELLIYPKQQRRDDYFRLDLTDCGKVRNFSFDAYGDLEPPRAWRMNWCKEHKSVSYEVYVPRGTGRLCFEPHFGDSISVVFR